MDVFDQGDTPNGMKLEASVGGSPFNVALGLARLDQTVKLFGGVSEDRMGQRLMKTLRREKIGTDAIVQVKNPTTLSLVTLDENGVPVYSFRGENCADRQLPMAALDRVSGTAKAFHFGSYAMVVEPAAQTLRALVEREHQRGEALISYDPNVRPTVEPKVEKWREVLEWMVSRTSLLKISAEDLELLYPNCKPADLATQWIAKGVAMVVITRGAEGAWAWTAQHHVAIDAKPCEMVDTVGAGDSFQAALLAWLADNNALSVTKIRELAPDQLKKALGCAAEAAAFTCSRPGADLPRSNDLGEKPFAMHKV